MVASTIPNLKNEVNIREVFLDPKGREVRWETSPQRIISLIPSLTETLFALGAGERIVAVTRFCKYPKAEIATRPKIGGVHDLDRERILSLKPDLIIANREENKREDIEYLAQEVTVYVTFPKTIHDVQVLILALGILLEAEEKAYEIVHKIQQEHQKAKRVWSDKKPLRTFYPVWYDPYYSINRDTYISNFLAACGAENIFAHKERRYLPIDMDEVFTLNPEVILLPSEPFKFEETHKKELMSYGRQMTAVKNNRVYLVDGEIICWWGVHMTKGFSYLTNILWGDKASSYLSMDRL
jgi:ABC-type Fe3+-hydroxamate transport system substrate-binding protein